MYGCSADPCLSNNDDGSETLKEKTNLNYVTVDLKKEFTVL